jgi:hypothetical protein
MSRLPLAFAFLTVIFVAGPALADAETDVVKACTTDVEKLCPGITPGGGKIAACLKKHENQVTVGCAKAIAKVKAGQ